MPITVMLRPAQPIPDHFDPTVDRAGFERDHAAAPADLAAVTAYASAHGLTVDDADAVKRSVVVSGSDEALKGAFGDAPSTDGIATPRSAAPVPAAVAGVLGLAFHPGGVPKNVVSHRAPDEKSLTPLEVAKAYRFPGGDGAGAHVAVISLGGRYDDATQKNYETALGVAHHAWNVVAVDGGADNPADAGPTGENTLDTEIIGTLAPAADKTIYIAPNSDRGFVDAIETALHDKHHNDIISISWGGPETMYEPAARAALDAAFREARAMGVSVFVAAGDGGSADNVGDGRSHVDFPAADPAVVACGGTQLRLAADGSIASETVWNGHDGGATGGGVSTIFPQPPDQAGSGVPKAPGGFKGRGVPDVAGNADPATGFEILMPPERRGGVARPAVVGGTSAVAPLYAALAARMKATLGHGLGDANAAIYAAPEGAFHDVVKGDNGAYKAGPGWDAATGRGSIVGDAFLAAQPKTLA